MFRRNSVSEAELFAELAREACISAIVGNDAPGIQPDVWAFPVTHSQRAGGAALLGVYGPKVEADVDLIQRALRNELTEAEVAQLEALRPLGETYRFGKDGRYGWVE